MKNSALQQTLVELEESLAQIESARNQVNSVTEKTEKLIQSFSMVLTSINSLNKGGVLDQAKLKKQFDDSIKTFQSNLALTVAGVEQHINQLQNRFLSQEADFKGELSKSLAITERSLNAVVSEFGINSNEAVEQLKTKLESFYDTINQLSERINKSEQILAGYTEKYQEFDFKGEMAALTNRVNVTQKRVAEIISAVSEQMTKVENRLKSLEKKIQDSSYQEEFELIRLKSRNRHYVSLVVSILGVSLIIAAIIFQQWIKLGKIPYAF
jgi:hypothetical protein